MEYQKAKDIRGTSFGDLMAKKLVGGGGIGESFKSTISEKTKATATGIKQSFDPLNMAKFMTGGSSLGPALLGKILGRSQKDIKFFAGKSKKGRGGSTLDRLLGKDNEIESILYNIEDLLKSSIEDDALQREKENNFAEERENERLKRHKELIEAITGKPYSGKATATKMAKDEEQGILDIIMDAFGFRDAKAGARMLLSVGRFFLMNPVGIGLLAGASLMYLLSNDKNPEATGKAILAAQDAGEANKQMEEAIQNMPVVEKRKQKLLADRPSSKKSLLFWKDLELGKKYLEEIGFDESTGLTAAEKEQGYIGLDANGNPIKGEDISTTVPSPMPTSTETSTGAASTGTATPAATETAPATPMESPNMGTQLQGVQTQNLDMKIPEGTEDPAIEVNNSITAATPSTQRKDPLPAVRNLEETFRRMILYSTRVV